MTPPIHLWSWFGKSICLSFDLITRFFHVSSLIQCCQIIGRVDHMFKSSPHLYWVIHLQLSFRFVLAFPVSKVQLPHTLFHFQTLLLILCHWWGIHKGPPVMSLVPSTPTHYPEMRLRNNLVPWNMQALMVCLFTFNRGFTSLIHNREIPLRDQLQLIHSHSFRFYFDTLGVIDINGDLPHTC